MTLLETLSTGLQVAPDTLRSQPVTTAYDSVWANVPTQAPDAFEKIMLSDDKIFVVLAVVLLIWAGIAIFLLRTDRKLDSLERTVRERIPEDQDAF